MIKKIAMQNLQSCPYLLSILTLKHVYPLHYAIKAVIFEKKKKQSRDVQLWNLFSLDCGSKIVNLASIHYSFIPIEISNVHVDGPLFKRVPLLRSKKYIQL